MDIKIAVLLLAVLYFSAAAGGMPYLMLKNAERLK